MSASLSVTARRRNDTHGTAPEATPSECFIQTTVAAPAGCQIHADPNFVSERLVSEYHKL